MSTSNEVTCTSIELHVTSFALHVTSIEVQCTSPALHVTSCEVGVTSCGLHCTSFALRPTSIELHASSFEMQVTLIELTSSSNEVHVTSFEVTCSSITDTNVRILSTVKLLFFVGTAREDLASFPETARRSAGYELFLVQSGHEPADFKALPDVGQGAYEIRVRDRAGAFRVIYVAKFEDAVYVLHAFQKKTRRTSAMDIELAKRRYRLIGVKS